MATRALVMRFYGLVERRDHEKMMMAENVNAEDVKDMNAKDTKAAEENPEDTNEELSRGMANPVPLQN